jgi:signal transduction histidine kinase
MTYVEITSLVAGIFHIVLTVFVLSRDWRSPANRVYFLWGMALTGWNFGVFISSRALQHGDAFIGGIAVRLIHFALVFVPVSGYHLYVLTAQESRRWTLRILYGVHILFAGAVFTQWYIEGLQPTALGYYAKGGPLSHIFLALLSIVSLTTIVLLYLKQRTLPLVGRTRLRALLLGFIILFLAGLNDFAPLFVQDFYPGTRIPFRPIANLASLFFAIIVSYAVLQHQLLDIRLPLSRHSAQLVRLSFLFLTSFLMLLALTWIAPAQFPTFALFGSMGVIVATVCVVAFLFPGFFGRGEEKLERWILGDQFEYQDQIREFTQRIPLYTQTDPMLADLQVLLVKSLGVSRYQIILLDETNPSFASFHSHPPGQANDGPELTAHSPLFTVFQATKMDYLVHGPIAHGPGEAGKEHRARQQLRQLGLEVCFPLRFGQIPFGLLLLGAKTSGEPYTGYDLKIMVELVKNLQLVLNLIRLTRQVLMVEEMELLGRMSRGMAHDLNNLLTTVWTYLQLAREKQPADPNQAELLPNVILNVETIRSYVREALFLSQTHTPRFQPARLDGLIRKSVELAESRLQRKHLTVQFDIQTERSAEVDGVLMQRLIGNVLANAIDASPEGAMICFSLMQLTNMEADREWLRLQLVDQGSGISKENMNKVAGAYFTTKDYGDETRGFGLGLAICRKIIHLHGGSLTLSSEPQKGATVQIDLPIQQRTSRTAEVGGTP